MVWLAMPLSSSLGLLFVIFVYVVFAKSVWVFEAVRFSRSCILVIDIMRMFHEVREGSPSCLCPKGPISIALNHFPCLSSRLAQKTDRVLSVELSFLTPSFSFFF